MRYLRLSARTTSRPVCRAATGAESRADDSDVHTRHSCRSRTRLNGERAISKLLRATDCGENRRRSSRAVWVTAGPIAEELQRPRELHGGREDQIALCKQRVGPLRSSPCLVGLLRRLLGEDGRHSDDSGQRDGSSTPAEPLSLREDAQDARIDPRALAFPPNGGPPPRPNSYPYEAPATDETYAATSWMCCRTADRRRRHHAPATVTRSTTSRLGGGAASRFGPTAPVARASASVWHDVQPPVSSNRLLALASPAGALRDSWESWSPRRRHRVARDLTCGILLDLLRLVRRHDGGHLREEEERRDEDVGVEPPREPRAPFRHEDRGHDRPGDEGDRDDEEPRFCPGGERRDEHREDATTDVRAARRRAFTLQTE